MLFLIRALSRLCHLSLVPSWHTLCPFAACVTGSWDVSALCDSFSGVTALPRLLLFLWHAGTCNHLSTGYTCTKLPGPSAAVSATAAAQAATHPWLQNTLPCITESCLEKLILLYIVLCRASQPSLLSSVCTSWAKGGKDVQWGKQSCSPAPLLLCWLSTAVLCCQHFPGTCIKHGPGAGHQQEISVLVSQQKVPNQLAAGGSVRGSVQSTTLRFSLTAITENWPVLSRDDEQEG